MVNRLFENIGGIYETLEDHFGYAVCRDVRINAYLNKDTEYGWEFLCMAQGDGEPEMTWVYKHE